MIFYGRQLHLTTCVTNHNSNYHLITLTTWTNYSNLNTNSTYHNNEVEGAKKCLQDETKLKKWFDWAKENGKVHMFPKITLSTFEIAKILTQLQLTSVCIFQWQLITIEHFLKQSNCNTPISHLFNLIKLNMLSNIIMVIGRFTWSNRPLLSNCGVLVILFEHSKV